MRVSLERPGAEGRMVGYSDEGPDGFVLLVAGGVPGEIVEAEVERVEARHALARVTAVERAAANRVLPPCPHYPVCSGCDMQHMTYAAQLDVKRRAFLDQLERIGGISAAPTFEVLPSPEPLRYRDRLDFLLRPNGAQRGFRPGFHGRNGGAFVPIDDCLLAPAELTRLARDAASALPASRGAAGVERIRVQAFSPENGPAAALGITLYVATSSDARNLEKRPERWLPDMLAAHYELAHVSSVLAGRPSHGPAGEEAPAEAATLLHGEALTMKRIGPWSYRVPPEAFFQVHPVQAAHLVSHVVESVNARVATARPATDAAPAAVLDLFCGVGLFTFPLAAAGYRVLGIELADAAVRAARRTAREAQERGAFDRSRRPEFKVRDLDAKGTLEDAVKSFGVPDVVVADPPRRGLSEHLVRGVLAVRPRGIVYVSCDGGTFARDAARLSEQYDLEQIKGFDLFPQTHHLEVVGLFTARR